MRQKLTVEQFRQYKKQLDEILKEYDKYESSNDEIEDKVYEEFIDKYTKIEKEITSYDLSNIPFEEWKEFTIETKEDEIIDFTDTHANIDFDIIYYSGEANFRSCNIKNLDKYLYYLDEKDFDEETIKKFPTVFLSDSFDNNFREKYRNRKLEISDFANLTESQIEELKNKNNLKYYIDYPNKDNINLYNIFNVIGMENAIKLYKEFPETYKVSVEIINNLYKYSSKYYLDVFGQADLTETLNKTKVSDYKQILYDTLKKQIINNKYDRIILDELPELFIKENPELFLLGENIDEEIRQKYYERRLTGEEVVDNIELFDNIVIDKFITYHDYTTHDLISELGPGNFQKVAKVYPKIIKYIIKSGDDRFSYNTLIGDLEGEEEEKFDSAIEKFKKIIEKYYNKKTLTRKNGLMNYEAGLFELEEKQQKVIDKLNIEFIKQFEEEYGFFSRENGISTFTDGIPMFENFVEWYPIWESDVREQPKTYEEFKNTMANCIEKLRRKGKFKNAGHIYDYLEGEFREEHKEIFMDRTAPSELRHKFYANELTFEDIKLHPEYIPFLMDKKLSQAINEKTRILYLLPAQMGGENVKLCAYTDFVDIYVDKYGKEEFFKLCSKYGNFLDGITFYNDNGEIDDKELTKKGIIEAIYINIINSKESYKKLKYVQEFVDAHNEIFINLDELTDIPIREREFIEDAYYSKQLSKSCIMRHPQLVEIFKEKDLLLAFGYNNNDIECEIIEKFGEEKFLELCVKYGDYFDAKHNSYYQKNYDLTNFETLCSQIEEKIYKLCKMGIQSYNENAPEFLKQEHKELFLEEDAPYELRKHFYNYAGMNPFNFHILAEHKDWLPYLKGKSIVTAYRRNTNHSSILTSSFERYLELFGEEKAIKLGINRPETVERMLMANKADTIKDWYDKTGQKFIPDFVVMTNIPIEEADKFLSSGANWSNLMKIKSYSSNSDSREAMLKLAYSFGAFDQDTRGYKKLIELLTCLPKKIETDKGYIIEQLDKVIATYTSQDAYDQIINHESSHDYHNIITTETLSNLIEAIKKEKFNIDFTKPILSQIYKKNEDDSYTLTINQQSYPKTVECIKNILNNFNDLNIITPNKAHHYFGGFKLEYNPEFREFFLANFEEIMSTPKYLGSIFQIQKRFTEISTIYRNVHLTLELAYSYIEDNRYENVNVGNERVPKVAAINKDDQKNYEVLQQIYNYAKQRVLSSIPRIEGSTDKYTYEIIRLDDPIGMAIGTITTCCQELGNAGRQCMEHSMVDKNGRLFIVKSHDGVYIAQSWVWRNKDVLCFDNIEVPNPQMWAHGIPRGHEDDGIRNYFTDEILDLYKQAAAEIMKLDEETYKKLLEEGKITQEQYDENKLRKITAGEGYSNIKGSLYTLKKDKEIRRPFPFKPPVEIGGIYYTNDSLIQYVLDEKEEEQNKQNKQENNDVNLLLYNDDYIEYDDSNFDSTLLHTLNRLEAETKKHQRHLNTSIYDETSKEIVSDIADNYYMNSKTARIVINPNFAIIYDTEDDQIKIYDLFYNLKVDNGNQQMDIEKATTMQIALALKQISKDKKEINTDQLNEEQKEMYQKAINLDEELDIERGISHAR